MRFWKIRWLKILTAIIVQLSLLTAPVTLVEVFANTIYYEVHGNLDQDSLVVVNELFTHQSLKPTHVYDIMGFFHLHDPYWDFEGVYPGSDPVYAYMTLRNDSRAPIELTMSAQSVSKAPELDPAKPLAPQHVPGVDPVQTQLMSEWPEEPHLSNPPNLADVLWLVVTLDKEPGQSYDDLDDKPLYNGWLSGFDEEAAAFKSIPMGSLSAKSYAKYKFAVTMWPGADNRYQNLSADFDVFLTGEYYGPLDPGPERPTPTPGADQPTPTPDADQSTLPSGTDQPTPPSESPEWPMFSPDPPTFTETPIQTPIQTSTNIPTQTPINIPIPTSTETPIKPPIQETNTPPPTDSAPLEPTPGAEELVTLPTPAPPPGGGLTIDKMPPTGEEPVARSVSLGLLLITAGLMICCGKKRQPAPPEI
ncbi:MAG: hypothetical protein LBT44_02365 [Clostridiales bacterium]|nr:hypothetical protein [Clostridiales bacterium]